MAENNQLRVDIGFNVSGIEGLRSSLKAVESDLSKLGKSQQSLSIIEKELLGQTKEKEKSLDRVAQIQKKVNEATSESVNVSKKAIDANKVETLSNDQLTDSLEKQKAAFTRVIALKTRMDKTGTAPVAQYKSITDITTRPGIIDPNTGKIFNEVTKSTQDLNESLKPQPGFFGRIGQAVKDTNKSFNDLRWSIVNVSFTIATLGALASPFILLTKAGMDLEFQMKKIGIVTGQSMESAKNAVLSLRQGTLFSIEEMGNAYFEFTKRGFDASEALVAMPAVARLASVGFTTLDSATEIVTQNMHEFSMGAEDAAHITDVLAKAANISAADVETFGTAMAYAGPIAAQAGISFEETAASLSIISNMGLTASKAGTSFAAALTQMMSPTDQVKDKMGRMGISFFEANGEMKSIEDIIRQLSSALGDLPEEEKLEFLVDAFGARGARAISALMSSFESGKGSIKSFVEALDEPGYAAQRMAELNETATARMTRAWNDFKNTLIPTQQYLAGLFSDILENMSAASKSRNLEIVTKDAEKYGIAITDFRTEEEIALNESVSSWGTWARKVTGLMLGPSAYFSGLAPMPGIFGDVQYGEKIIEAQTFMTENEKKISNLQNIQFEKTKLIIDVYEELNAVGAIRNNQEIENVGNLEKFIKTLRNIPEQTKDMTDEETIAYYKKIEEASNATLMAYEKMEKPVERTKKLETDIKKEIETAGPLYKNLIGLTSEEVLLVERIKVSKSDILNATHEIADSEEEILKKVRAYNSQVEKTKQLFDGFVYSFNELKTKYGGILDPKQVSEANAIIEDFSTLLNDVPINIIGKDFAEQIAGSIVGMERYRDKIVDLVAELNALRIEYEGVTYTEAQFTIVLNSMKLELDSAKELLKQYKDELADVNDTIKKLSQPRFGGQGELEHLINNLELYQKRQQLAKLGIVDVFQFLQDALKASTDDYDDFLKVIEETNDATKDGKNEYDAWRETVRAFIVETLTSGNDLRKNVSGAVKQYKTLLLSTSKFTDSTESQSSAINTLQLAYDVHYGQMIEDVRASVQAHEDATYATELNNGQLFTSAEQVIQKLTQQWTEQERVSESLRKQTAIVDVLEASYNEARGALDQYKVALENINLQIDDMVKGIKEFASAIANLQTPSAPASTAAATSAPTGGTSLSDIYPGGGNVSLADMIQLTADPLGYLANQTIKQTTTPTPNFQPTPTPTNPKPTPTYEPPPVTNPTNPYQSAFTPPPPAYSTPLAATWGSVIGGGERTAYMIDRDTPHRKYIFKYDKVDGASWEQMEKIYPDGNWGTVEKEFYDTYAKGGLVTKPSFGLMGEAGPELILPLKPRQSSGLPDNLGLGGHTISIGNVNISGVSGDPSEFAHRFAEELRRELQRI